MKEASAAVLTVLIAIITSPAPLSAKGRTVKITIKGAGLTRALEITDTKVEQFNVWDGLGTWRNGVEGREGFIINWSKGIVAERPTGLQHYEVAFYSGCRMNEFGCRTSKPSLVYVVSYDYDPSTQQGFVYLPGKDDEALRFNHGMWHGHGFEGNWAYATSAWESFVRPLIARAKATVPQPR